MITDLTAKLKRKNYLSKKEANQCMSEMFGEETQDGDIYDFLNAMNERMAERRIASEELAGFVQGIMSRAIRISPDVKTLIDTCGTGGDGKKTINASTTAAIAAASAGISVAKHGNAAMSSKSGSADVIAALGYKIPISADEVERRIEQNNFAFILAPYFHPALKRVSHIRKSIGRTVFNLLGPLSNPANLTAQVVGVYDSSLCEPFCYALKERGLQRALVVHSCGLDELSTIGPITVYELRDGKITHRIVRPEEFGYRKSNIEDLKGGDSYVNATFIRDIFNNKERGPKRDLVTFNIAAAIYAGKGLSSLQEGVCEAEELIYSGAAARKLEEITGNYQ